MQYDLILHDGHAIFKLDDQKTVLLDTGVPISFHTTRQINFEGAVHPTSISLGKINVTEVSRLIGMPITTIFGGDILSKYKVCMDYHNRTITFEPLSYTISEGELLPVNRDSNYLLLPVEINGKKVLGYLDTGAKLSYVSRELTNGMHDLGREQEDFYIGIGNFNTQVYSADAILSDSISVECIFGVLPSQISSAFFNQTKQAIIGYDLFIKNKKVWIDYSNDCIHVVK